MMAVAHIKANPAWFKATAALMKDRSPKAARELLRAAERPGLQAQLDSDEVATLIELLPEDEFAVAADAGIREALAREGARTKRVRDRIDEVRGKPPA